MEAKSATKVSQIESFKDSQVDIIVCRGKLVLIDKTTDETIGSLFQMIEGGNDIFISNNPSVPCKSIKPIIISTKEEIEVGDMYLKGIYILKNDGESTIDYFKDCHKILALPEHFSPKQLQAIVDGKLKDGDEVFVECKDKWIEAGFSLDVEKSIKLNKSNHIKLFPVKQEEIKTYRVIDNSQQECLNDSKNHYLAGTLFDYNQQTVEVIAQPFEREYINSVTRKTYKQQFIIGKCDKGLYHLIMYF